MSCLEKLRPVDSKMKRNTKPKDLCQWKDTIS